MNYLHSLLVCTVILGTSALSQAQNTRPVFNAPQQLNTTPGESRPTPRLMDRLGERVQPASSIQTSSSKSNTPLAVLDDEDKTAIDDFLRSSPSSWTDREGLTGSLRVLLTMSVLSLAPAILLMTTCYVRIVIVLGLLRQALGTGQLPSTQIITSISLFMTLFIMAPVWNRVYQDSVKPYTAEGSQMSLEDAWTAGVEPVREFMSRQIDVVDNEDDVHLFYNHYSPGATPPTSWEEIPLQVLLPAYLLSELKTAFLMGFMIFLPFLIIDLVVAAVTISMGMMMLPPAMISLPFKLLLFVLVDGWHLVVGMLLSSFATVA